MGELNMCGIAGIISRTPQSDTISFVKAMSDSLAHRGPDGEGFLLSDLKKAVPCTSVSGHSAHPHLNYLPAALLSNAGIEVRVALAHRRLSIIDLSEAGHEPMCDKAGRTWITFNGEIYNYIELKKELEALGYHFRSSCDTEVILYSYAQWGEDCVQKFNGMWAFCILDLDRQICFASRDRLGVKPFYYIDNKNCFAFASEQKAFVRSGLVKAHLNKRALHNYLINGLLESERENFFEGVMELWPGHSLVYNLRNHEVELRKYFELKEGDENEQLSDEKLISLIREGFENSIRLRLRSDVEVGTCLSGGIDSSAIAVTIARQSKKPLHCFTAVFPGREFSEGGYAGLVANKISGIHHLTEPRLEELMRDFDELVYSQDSPIWDTSTYAQHRVMALAKSNGIKVVLDGQGADELFTGYHHHFTAKWNNLLKRGKVMELYKDIRLARASLDSPFVFFLKEQIKKNSQVNPASHQSILKTDFSRSFSVINPFNYRNSVNEQLIDDITRTRLKIFLKCEDRCGMWHGVESRTPFSDDKDLIKLMFSFNGNRKIQKGKLKYFLREAVKDELPAKIYNRTDKRGFETPMQEWIGKLSPVLTEEIAAAGFDFVDMKKLRSKQRFSPRDNKLLFKLFVLARWQKVFA